MGLKTWWESRKMKDLDKKIDFYEKQKKTIIDQKFEKPKNQCVRCGVEIKPRYVDEALHGFCTQGCLNNFFIDSITEFGNFFEDMDSEVGTIKQQLKIQRNVINKMIQKIKEMSKGKKRR